MAAVLFGYGEKITDDMLQFSEVIDALVEERVSLTEFLAAISSRLDRAVEGRVSGQRLRGQPGGPVQRSHLAPERLAGEAAEIEVLIEPPLPAPAARFIRQRLIHAVKLIAHYDVSVQVSKGDRYQVRLLLEGKVSESRRVDMLRQFGIAGVASLTAVAIAGAGQSPERANQLVAALADGANVLTARMGDVLAVILRSSPNLEVGIPEGLSLGIGEPLEPGRIHESWQGATTALRFSLPSKRGRGPYRSFDAVIVDIRNVGPMRVLAEAVNHADVRALPDVKAIRELAEGGHPDTLAVLEAVAATESIRQAAKLVHLHHNTVAQRAEAAERVLGFEFRGHYGRARLLTGLTLHRLSVSAVALADVPEAGLAGQSIPV